jgi:4a-hydroxytetrahydrobiopterin dehydratase
MSPLPATEIQHRLLAIPQWQLQDGAIQRIFHCQSFPHSIAWVNQVAALAEAADHHPEIEIHYRQVTLSLSTHDVNGLTEKDFALAEQCDTLFASLAP